VIEIASIVAVCKTALDTGKQAAEAYRKKKLSDVEKELLAAAAKETRNPCPLQTRKSAWRWRPMPPCP